jgi:hypothetical protein
VVFEKRDEQFTLPKFRPCKQPGDQA